MKSPKKPQMRAAGQAANDVTITTWVYKTTTESKLLDTPPNLTGHPENLVLGDIYFDRVRDAYHLWLWCLDEVGVAHWEKVPFGYQRGDGKFLIVTPKNFLPSWVAPSYYKQIVSGGECTTRLPVWTLFDNNVQRDVLLGRRTSGPCRAKFALR